MPSSSPMRRRPHTKSRTGCAMCKKRRVKCDEAKPSCRNCIRFSFACDYTSNSQTISSYSSSPDSHSEGASSQSSTTPARTRKPGRPRKNWNLSTQPIQSPVSQDALKDCVTRTCSDSAALLSDQDSVLNIDDLELLHHYVTSTSNSFAGDDPVGQVYRINLPRMGRAFPFVLRLLLALAAQHQRYLEPQGPEKERNTALAEKHFSIALPQISQLLPALCHDNCQAIYISSILICFYIFARGPSPGEYLVFSEHGPPLWLPLLRGVRSIMDTMGQETVFSGPLAPMRGDDSKRSADAPTVARLNVPRLEWEEPFCALRLFISSSAEPVESGVYLRALENLAQTFEATYGNDENGSYSGDSLNQIIFRWLYILEDDFIQLMQQKQPHALIIVAYFAMLMKILDMEGCWFLEGWSKHILLGIHGCLDEEYHIWMQWPMEKAGVE